MAQLIKFQISSNMAPKVKSNKKPGKQNYPVTKDEYRLENLIIKYIKLENTSITYKEFTYAMACRVLHQPL